MITELMRPCFAIVHHLFGATAFKQVLHDLGIPAYWHEHGFPPLCRAVGAKDFTCD